MRSSGLKGPEEATRNLSDSFQVNIKSVALMRLSRFVVHVLEDLKSEKITNRLTNGIQVQPDLDTVLFKVVSSPSLGLFKERVAVLLQSLPTKHLSHLLFTITSVHTRTDKV